MSKIKIPVCFSLNDLLSLREKNTLLIVILLGFFLFAGINVKSQSTLDQLIGNTLERNKTLIAAQQFYEAEVLVARTGNSPENPEIEYAYLWGSPQQLGNRVDFSVMQSFDFPTAYSSRNKLSKINREQASLRYKITEQKIVLKARKAWIKAVYYNLLQKLLEKRLKNNQYIAEAAQRLFDEGEANQIDLNQAKLKLIALQNDVSSLKTEVIANSASIAQLNGGIAFTIADSSFPIGMNVSIDTLLTWYKSGPRNRAFRQEVSRLEQQKDVIFNQKLPRLKAGYYQETILGTKLSGFRAGITIPLWENTNAVKSAKAGYVYAQTDASRFWEQQELQIKQAYDQWLVLKTQVTEFSDLLKDSKNDELLLKALESGEISLSQYYYESDFYFDNKFVLLDLKRDLQLMEATLLSVRY